MRPSDGRHADGVRVARARHPSRSGEGRDRPDPQGGSTHERPETITGSIAEVKSLFQEDFSNRPATRRTFIRRFLRNIDSHDASFKPNMFENYGPVKPL